MLGRYSQTNEQTSSKQNKRKTRGGLGNPFIDQNERQKNKKTNKFKTKQNKRKTGGGLGNPFIDQNERQKNKQTSSKQNKTRERQEVDWDWVIPGNK